MLVAACISCAVEQEDHSLTLEEYMALGMPDPNRKWLMSDYVQARNVLSQLRWREPLQLPAKDSKKSGGLFEHMLSLEYLSFLGDTSMALHEKAMHIVEFVRVYEYWIEIYDVPILKKNHYHREIVALQLFNLRLMEAMLGLANQINESDDPADIALQYGYKAIKGNYLSALDADLRTQRYGPPFLEHDLNRMADSIYASAMRNRSVLDSSEIGQLVKSLQLVMDSTSSSHIRDKYSILLKELKRV